MAVDEPLNKHSKSKNRRDRVRKVVTDKKFIIGAALFGLLVIIAIVLGVTLGTKSRSQPEYDLIPVKWWQNATFYRVYVNSFYDWDGDGLGDLKGIQEKLSYLKELGVDGIWLSPIQETNSVSGLDVTNFKAASHGWLQDFKDLIVAAKEMGFKVMMDLIMNQSGNTHSWFKLSQNRTEPYTDYYIWSKGRVDRNGSWVPPNNWMSVHGGSAWKWSDVRQEFYLHQFWKNEPDLNFRNLRVVQEMKDLPNFWLSVGVDGFYLRDIAYLVEDSNLRDENVVNSTLNGYSSLDHIYTTYLPENFDVVNQIFGPIFGTQPDDDKVLTTLANEKILSDIRWSSKYSFMMANTLYNLNFPLNGVQLKESVEKSIRAFNESKLWPIWVLGDEDKSRASSKFYHFTLGLQALQILLPGSPSIYFGDEIKATNHSSITYAETIDSVGKDAGPTYYQSVSRDPCRTPMRWNSSKHAGFTSARTPWLPTNSRDPSVNDMRMRSESFGIAIKELLNLRKSSIALVNGTIDYPLVENTYFTFTRTHLTNNTGFLVAWNLGDSSKTISFQNITYISQELKLIRTIEPDRSFNENFRIVKKDSVTLDPRKMTVYSFMKN